MPAAPRCLPSTRVTRSPIMCGTCTRFLPTRTATTTLASWAMSIWTPRKTVARSFSKTTASALSRTCSRTSRTDWNKTKRGRWRCRQRPRFCTIRYALFGILDLIRIRLGWLIVCLWHSLTRLVKRRLHGLVAPGELANRELIGLVVSQTQVLVLRRRSSLVFSSCLMAASISLIADSNCLLARL